MPRKKRLSKSQYLRGLQCPKALWLYRHRPDLAPEIPESQQHLFDTGHEVGLLAQEYFAGGTLIDTPYYAVDQALRATQAAVERGASIIFEASAASDDGAFSRIDILKQRPQGSDWELIEVKSATEVKDYHLDDIAFQRHAFEGAGYTVAKSVLMHIDSSYVRMGPLDLGQLFALADCTALMPARMADIAGRLRDLLTVLADPSEPEIAIGDQCTSPFECGYIPYCWQHVPEYSVYNVFGGRKLAELLGEGILAVTDVPAGFDMTERQAIEVRAAQSGAIHVQPEGLREFLDALAYPVHFLDYETIMPAVPLFDRSRPYQQIPFQFSLHIQPRRGAPTTGSYFLHTGTDDPRSGFVRALLDSCGTKGSVIVYNQPFEARINTELARDFPEHAAALDGITARMHDLLMPFRSRLLYHPRMHGSASLKSVLPAFVPEMDYSRLAIADGTTASLRYLRCIRNQVTDEEKEDIYKNLIEYCTLDTLAEVRLLEVLYGFA